MKTSTKILIFLMLCVPASLLAYNTLLKQQLTAKNFLVEMRANPADLLTGENLPPFKHLVVDGALYTGEGIKQAAVNVTWYAKVRVENIHSLPLQIRIPQLLRGVVKYKVKNDTLYVSYYKKSNTEALSNDILNSPVITINGFGNLRSVTGVSTRFETGGNFNTTPSFAIKLSNKSEYKMEYTHINNLNITAKEQSKFDLIEMTADTLSYSLLDLSRMEIAPLNIHNYRPGQVDDRATVAIHGNANRLKSFLK